MTPFRRWLSRSISWPAFAAAVAVGLAGGALFDRLSLPLAWMLGPMVAVTIAVTAGMKAEFPPPLTIVCQSILGLLLGSAFTPDVFARAAQWATTVFALLVYVTVMAATIAIYFRKVIGYDPVTSYFAAMPGGLAEMIIIGQSMGGDGRTIALIQSARILIVVLCIPLGFRFIAGYEPQGIQALGGGLFEIAPADAVALLICAVAGYWLARLVRFPAPFMTGALIVSAAAHVTGVIEARPPGLVIAFAQLGIGTTLGCQFVGVRRSVIFKTLGIGAATVTIMLGITLAFSLGLAAITDFPVSALLLAYAPGGITEMTIIALALGFDVVFVASHQLIRIMFVVLMAPMIAKLLRGGRRPPADAP